jgi:hypothetical protein
MLSSSQRLCKARVKYRLFNKDRLKGEIGGRELVGAMGIKAPVALK